MKNLKEQEPDVEINNSAKAKKSVDVELNEDQLELVAGGVMEGPNGCCVPFPDFINFPDEFLPKAPDIDESI